MSTPTEIEASDHLLLKLNEALKQIESDVSRAAETKQLTKSVMQAYNGCLYRCLGKLKKAHGILDIGLSWSELLAKDWKKKPSGNSNN